MTQIEDHARLCAEMMQAMGAMPGMMGEMGAMGGMGAWAAAMAVLWLLVPIAILLLVVLVAAALIRSSRRLETAPTDASRAADLRYARGELTREEYMAIRHELDAR